MDGDNNTNSTAGNHHSEINEDLGQSVDKGANHDLGEGEGKPVLLSQKTDQFMDASEDHSQNIEKSDTRGSLKEPVNTDAFAVDANSIELKSVNFKDVDPSSEDIELKWEDDNDDDDETLLDNDTPILIENIKLSDSDFTKTDKEPMEVDPAVDHNQQQIQSTAGLETNEKDPVAVSDILPDSDIKEKTTNLNNVTDHKKDQSIELEEEAAKVQALQEIKEISDFIPPAEITILEDNKEDLIIATSVTQSDEIIEDIMDIDANIEPPVDEISAGVLIVEAKSDIEPPIDDISASVLIVEAKTDIEPPIDDISASVLIVKAKSVIQETDNDISTDLEQTMNKDATGGFILKVKSVAEIIPGIDSVPLSEEVDSLPINVEPVDEDIYVESALIYNDVNAEEQPQIANLITPNIKVEISEPLTCELELNVDETKPSNDDDVESFLSSNKPIGSASPDAIESNNLELQKIFESHILDGDDDNVDIAVDNCDVNQIEEYEDNILNEVAVVRNAPIVSTDNAETTDNPQSMAETNEPKSDENEPVSCTVQTSNIQTDIQIKNVVLPSVSAANVEKSAPDTIEKDAVIVDAVTTKIVGAVTTHVADACTTEMAMNVDTANTISEDMAMPSTSTMDLEEMSPDASDEIPEVTDSHGLLAESTMRVIDEEDDEEDDEEFDGDDADDGGDDESNPITAEHSEDSNAQTSENETKEQEPKLPVSDISFAGKLPQNETKDSVEKGDAMEQDKKDDGTVGIDGSTMEVDEPVEEIEEKIPKEIPATTETSLDTDYTKSGDESTTDAQQMDVDTVKISDNSDSDAMVETKAADTSILKRILNETNDSERSAPNESKSTDSPSKLKKLEMSRKSERNVVSIVDLGGSSSEDDIQEIKKAENDLAIPTESSAKTDDIPKDIEQSKKVESKSGEAIPLPESSTSKTVEEKSVKVEETASSKSKFGLEVFTLDSDEEEPATVEIKAKTPSPKLTSPTKKRGRRCVNPACPKDDSPTLSPDSDVLRFYDVKRKKKALVCQTCSDVVTHRVLQLMEGVKSMLPLLELDMIRPEQELVEISDSDSDEELHPRDETHLGIESEKMLEAELANMINDTWHKYDLDDRLKIAKDEIELQLQDLEKERKEIDTMLNECQRSTDALRSELYVSFTQNVHQLTPMEIFDTPHLEYSKLIEKETETEVRRSKRPRSQILGSKSAIPLGFRDTPVDPPPTATAAATAATAAPVGVSSTKPLDDDNQDISVVQLSVEAPPSGLPAAGVEGWQRPQLAPGLIVYGMRHAFGSWLKAKVLEVYPKTSSGQFTMCKVRFEHRGVVSQVTARHLAYSEVAPIRLTIGTRVIALFQNVTSTVSAKRGRAYYSGVVAEMPNPVNNYRYLVFFDDGYAQYVAHEDTRVVCECSPLVWEEVHPFSRDFVRLYLLNYPERPMVRLHAGQSCKTEWNGKWWVSKVVAVDASLVKIHFEADNRTEWIYRGSTRLAPLFLELQAAERPKRHKHARQTNVPYVEYTRSYEQETTKTVAQIQQEEIKRQRAVAKKSTSLPTVPQPQTQPLDSVMSRVVYYTPKAAVKPHKMVSHTCSARCQRTDVLPLKELRTYNPLARPLLSGWERQIVRFKGRKEVMYRAPCGRRLRNMKETHTYLRLTHSDMSVDLFDFAINTHCLAEFVLNRCLVSKKDLSHGKENVPVPCVNYYDNSLPEFCSYNTERTPTAGVPLNIDPEFLCGCDCEDDCMDKSKCECWKLTLTGARTIGMDGDEVGYVYRRLLEPVPSGIYECNSRCKCKQTCLNRVAQHPLQLKLQVFKTQNRGWGIRALNDVPRGAFLCVYAGNLLTDATANLDGLNEGDEYLAELDYIEVVEQMKEGYEQDIPDADKKLDENQSDSESESDSAPSDDENKPEKNDIEDDDFKPAYEIPYGVLEFNKRLRKRDKKKKDKIKGEVKEEIAEPGEKRRDEDCITISDDEEVREPQRFTAQTSMGGNDITSKYRSVRSFFGKDEACYIMDAKVQGNIGRYLNHSCTPNVFVQNVFVDTHDPRFPWVSFFALSHIRAGAELTWNYNYDVGSVPGKTLICYCGAPNCRGRLL